MLVAVNLVGARIIVENIIIIIILFPVCMSHVYMFSYVFTNLDACMGVWTQQVDVKYPPDTRHLLFWAILTESEGHLWERINWTVRSRNLCLCLPNTGITAAHWHVLHLVCLFVCFSGQGFSCSPFYPGLTLYIRLPLTHRDPSTSASQVLDSR